MRAPEVSVRCSIADSQARLFQPAAHFHADMRKSGPRSCSTATGGQAFTSCTQMNCKMRLHTVLQCRRQRGRRACAQQQVQPAFPPSTTVVKKPDYSLRLYEPFVALQVAYDKRESGYDAAAAYFKGMNADGMTFQETQPTFLCYAADGAKCMRLFVGPTRSGDVLESPPSPEMPECSLVAAGGELCAVLRFEGYITPTTANAALEQLKDALARDDVAVAE